jgi:16S rRNA (guanine966-N2)-methyltransferase
MGACTRRIAVVSIGIQASSLHTDRASTAAWCMPSPRAPPTRIKPLVVRIVAGSKKGHRIEAPKGVVTRPTGDRVREAVFSILGSVDGARALDLFAGSGALGLEALSRGATSCVFVERDRGAVRVIQANLERLHLTGAVVVARDASAALREERERGRRFDLVLADPPYEDWERHEAALAELVPSVLADDGLVVVETAERVEPALPLDLVTTRRYGSARITVFSR